MLLQGAKRLALLEKELSTPIIAVIMAHCHRMSFPTDGVVQNYEWCKIAGPPGEVLRRLEAFWSLYHPRNEQYDDNTHRRLVRDSAFDLARLYARNGNSAKCVEFIDWIERSA